MIKILGSPLLRQYAVVIIANLSALCTGFGLGWSSPVLVKLTNGTDTVLQGPITVDQGSWLVSVSFLSGIPGIFLTGYLLDAVGRKYCLILSCVPRIPMALMYLLARTYWVILAGRILSGVLDALAYTTVATYASEMASKEVRGSLGALLQINSSIGVLIALGVGPFVSYWTLNLILLCVVTGSSIPILFLPDSPYFLFSKGKTEDARKILLKLRGSDILAHEEIKEYQAVSQDEGKELVATTELLKNKVFLKGALIAVVVGFCSQANGYPAVAYYLQTVLEATNTSLRPEISSLIVGSIQLMASFCTTFVTDRFGRKAILIGTTSGVTLGLVGLGTFFEVTEHHDEVTGFMNYLPLVSIILIVFCYSSGIASILWVLVSEVFEGRTRATGTSFAILVATSAGFLITKSTPFLTGSIGYAMTYWGFGVICILFCLFTAFVIPETKGRSFAEIQEILGK
ncbi:facilitated trehalose transporter Tret1 [Amyelois transitella]|uniref:facilitated trehalose transporter Tret1 n=1 Tax=Amyelois transitella TaxID=680683 RepID=UPI00298F7AEC|nr:facilitated trehalose transporter Tret1 [Amyelois transitella]